jgi:hypothetical protein
MVVATLNTFEIGKKINKIGLGYLSKMTKAIDRRSLGHGGGGRHWLRQGDTPIYLTAESCERIG